MKKLSVIVRFHEGANIQLLRRALYSLLDERPISREVIVMVQFTSAALLEEVRTLCASLFEHATCRVAGVRVSPGQDRRGQLLTEGVLMARGSFLAFLDYDDVMFLGGVASTIAICEEEAADLAIAQCVVALVEGIFPLDFTVTKARFVRNVPRSPQQLLQVNFAPICGFVVSREFLSRKGINFTPHLSRVEDYDLLLRVLAAGNITLRPLQEGVVNAQYNLNVDVGSTTLLKEVYPGETLRQQEEARWEAAREHIRATLKSLNIGPHTLTDEDRKEANRICLNVRDFVRRFDDRKTA